MKRLAPIAWILTALVGSSAHATTFSFEFTSHTADARTLTGSNPTPYIDQYFTLTNAATGLSTIPSFNLTIADTVTGVIQLDHDVELPPSALSASIDIRFPFIQDRGSIGYQQSFAFYNDGVQVFPPPDLKAYSSSGGALTFGIFASTATPDFVFDKIVFSDTITGIFDKNDKPVASQTATNQAGRPTLELFWHPTNASVPEPDSAALLFCGLAVNGVTLRRQRKS
jgi:hypothetical protein